MSDATLSQVMTRINFASRREALLNQRELAIARFDARETFTGPSLHFHVTSLDAAKKGDINQFIDQVYALLPSWGMHRMGRKGPKMVEFDAFKNSVLAVENDLRQLREKTHSTMGGDDWICLKNAFDGINCMRTNVQLIGNSKVLAHWLPNLVPPIDREYTLAFMPYHGDISGRSNGWRVMETLLREFFHPILEDKNFRTFAGTVLAKVDGRSWHTSPMKLIDNLLIGSLSNDVEARATSSGQ